MTKLEQSNKWRGKGQKITVFKFDYGTQITIFNLVFSKILNLNFDHTNNIFTDLQ